MLRAPVVGPAAGRSVGVFDLHAHPTLKTTLFRRQFWKKHYQPGFMCPPCMRTDLDALIDGNCQVVGVAAYVVERGWLENFWPTHIGVRLSPALDRQLTAEPDDLTRDFFHTLTKQVKETNARRGNVVEIAYSYIEMKRIVAEGKVCLVNTIEGAHSLNGNLDNLQDFFDRGCASLIIPHMYPNEAGWCSNAIPEDLWLRKLGCFKQTFYAERGLTEWGRDLVRRMLEIGMIVDMTHGTPQFRRDVYEVAREYPVKRPLIMSHVGVQKYCKADINPDDDDIREIAKTGGAIGMIFMSTWICKPRVKMGREVIVNSIKHLVNVGGEDVAAIGTDFDGFTDTPPDAKSARDFVPLREMLLKEFTEAQVDKFLFGNADRVFREGWGKA